jgi:serine/threonine-protein kinase RsbW
MSAQTATEEVTLGLPARPENVAVVRQALAGVADALEIEVALAADMKIAVTEACTNAVLHAYDDEDGPLEVTMRAADGQLEVTVRDQGPGFKPLPTQRGESPLGFGLALIASLADAFAIRGGTDGTEIDMMFHLGLEPGESSPAASPQGLGSGRRAPPADSVVLSVPTGALAQPVLGRVLSLLAARVDFSIDRLSDAQIVSDALATHVGAHALDARVEVSVEEADRSLVLRVGPLRDGGGDALVAATELPGLGRLLPQLADEIAVEPAAEKGELLRLRMAEGEG